MYFLIKNPNVREVYPAIWNSELKKTGYMDKTSGKEFIAINLETASDFITLLSLAKVSNEYAIGLNVSGNEIFITEEPYTLGE